MESRSDARTRNAGTTTCACRCSAAHRSIVPEHLGLASQAITCHRFAVPSMWANLRDRVRVFKLQNTFSGCFGIINASHRGFQFVEYVRVIALIMPKQSCSETTSGLVSLILLFLCLETVGIDFANSAPMLPRLPPEVTCNNQNVF